MSTVCGHARAELASLGFEAHFDVEHADRKAKVLTVPVESVFQRDEDRRDRHLGCLLLQRRHVGKEILKERVKVISGFFPAGLPVSMFGLSVASGFAIFIGLVAGLYPSISASRLEPVEALRA